MSETRLMLEGELEQLRNRIGLAIAAGDAESHQIELDRLVWAYAGQEAARAVRQWFIATGHPVVELLANAAAAEASAQLHGQSWTEGVENGHLLAEIAADDGVLEDVGAT